MQKQGKVYALSDFDFSWLKDDSFPVVKFLLTNRYCKINWN